MPSVRWNSPSVRTGAPVETSTCIAKTLTRQVGYKLWQIDFQQYRAGVPPLSDFALPGALRCEGEQRARAGVSLLHAVEVEHREHPEWPRQQRTALSLSLSALANVWSRRTASSPSNK